MSLGKKMLNGAIWSGMERIIGQTIQFVIGIVLARILSPEEYGTISLILIFIVLSQVFVDSGFTKALIQKKDRNPDDVSTVFFFNLMIAVACYGLLYLAAPFVAGFFEIEILRDLLRVMALSLILDSFFTVPSTLFAIELNFKTPAMVYLTSVTIAGSIAIALAYDGFGVWALVWQTLIRSCCMVIGIWFFIKWKPKLVFSMRSLKHMFSYGSKLLVTSLLGVFFSKFNEFLIGKYINARELGLFTRGVQFTGFVSGTFNSMINRVFLPSLAPYQDDLKLLTMQTKKVIKLSVLVSTPIFILLFATAESLVTVLLTEKWIRVVPIMQLFCFSRLITVVSNINVNLLYVLGKTNLVLRQEYLKISIRVVLILSALKYGIVFIAIAELVTTVFHFFINSYYPGKLMQFGSIKQLKAIAKTLFAGVVMLAVVLPIGMYVQNDYMQLGVTVVAGLATYYLLLRLLKVKELDILKARVSEVMIKYKR
ncbi:lipopolysaccharide biosynthesis protein [Flagellimonas sp. DF-77]|uniref:lipopolysaccharide biosynthesis protein n=1 Tax=Flagellimonas algarum TaxID=3230298 RepID=UPI00339123FC